MCMVLALLKTVNQRQLLIIAGFPLVQVCCEGGRVPNV